jgi:hypothetical protein
VFLHALIYKKKCISHAYIFLNKFDKFYLRNDVCHIDSQQSAVESWHLDAASEQRLRQIHSAVDHQIVFLPCEYWMGQIFGDNQYITFFCSQTRYELILLKKMRAFIPGMLKGAWCPCLGNRKLEPQGVPGRRSMVMRCSLTSMWPSLFSSRRIITASTSPPRITFSRVSGKVTSSGFSLNHGPSLPSGRRCSKCICQLSSIGSEADSVPKNSLMSQY